MPEILWEPNRDDVDNSNMVKFIDFINKNHNLNINEYNDLFNYSIKNIEVFWKDIMEYFSIKSHGNYEYILSKYPMPGNKWFGGLKLNYAENVFKNSTGTALIYKNEMNETKTMSYEELKMKTGALYNFLRVNGIKSGDVIATYLSNTPENIISFLASASLGCIFSSISIDFGSRGAMERLMQLSPKVLIVTEKYYYGGREYEKTKDINEILKNIQTIKLVITVNSINKKIHMDNDNLWDINDIFKDYMGKLKFREMEFNDPLWVLFSSGTTGKPKGIVHSHGGILLEHLKSLSLHLDLKRSDRLFWYTGTGWMMWNFMISSLLLGSTVVLYDGSPFYPDLNVLWDYLNINNVKYFGTSAAYINYLKKSGFKTGNAENIHAIFYTGSPLSADGYRYIYSIKRNVWFTGISGGTDICSAFFEPNIMLGVYAGEMQSISLGDSVKVYDDSGNPVVNKIGELIIDKPMPSMPVYLWNDIDYKIYNESYFNYYKNVWRHGDFAEITDRNTAIIYGRSDSTLNKNGIRMGTSEIYNIVDNISGVRDSLIIGMDIKDGYYMPLFISLNDKNVNIERIKSEIINSIKEYLPRYIPDEILIVDDIPKTINGKKVEVPIKKILLGYNVTDAVNPGSLMNPESLDYFIKLSKRLKNKLNS